MATKIKGITIELSADTSGLESALKNVNKELKSTQSQLNSVNRSLKLDPGNAELLEQKQRLLAKAIQETTDKLEALNKAQSHVSSTGGGQDQYDALTREISDTTVQLQRLQQEQTSVGNAMSQATGQSNGFSNALGAVSSACGAAAQKTQALSAAAGIALGALTALTVKASQQADEWLTLSQQTGLSTEAVQKFAYAADQIDVDFSTVESAIRRMKANLDGCSDTWAKLGVDVRNQKGEYKDIEQIFNETVSAISRIGNETERDTAAMEIFGKSADELAGILDDGGEKMKALGDEAESMGIILSDEDLEKLGHFNDLLDQMKAQMQGALAALAVPVGEALLPVVEAIAQAFKGLASVLSAVPTPLLTVMMAFLAVAAIMSPLLNGISSVCGGLQMLIGILPSVGSALGAMMSAAASYVASNPYVLLVGVIIAALALLAYAIYEIVDNWDAVSDSASSAFSGVEGAIKGGLSALSDVGDSIMGAFDGIPTAIDSIGEAFSHLGDSVHKVIGTIQGKLSDLRNKAFNAGKDLLKAFGEGITSVINQVVSAVQRLAQAISNIWRSMEMEAGSSGRQVASNFAQSYNSGQSMIKSFTLPSSTRSGGASSLSAGLAGAMNNLSASLDRYAASGASATNVNVELVGSAKNIFDTVRVQNAIMQTATGYHALA